MRVLKTLLLALVSVVSLMAASQSDPIRVLILSGRSSHDWRANNPIFVDLLESTGRFQVDITNRVDGLSREVLAPYRLILCNWTTYKGHTELEQWPAEAKEALLEFVRNGGGHMLVHVSGSNFYSWPEYQEMIGGASWKAGRSKFIAPGTPLPTRPTAQAQSHPITQGIGPLTIIDELYTRMDLNPSVTTLVEAYADKKYRGDDEWYPVAGVNPYGEGRNFILLLGHSPVCMENPLFKTLFQRGAEWAATGRVTIPLISFEDYKIPDADPKSYRGHAAANPVRAEIGSTVPYDARRFSDAVEALRSYRKYESREALLKLETLVGQAAADEKSSAQAAEALINALKTEGAAPDARAHYVNFLGQLVNDGHLKAIAFLQEDKEVLYQLCALYERLAGTKAKGAIASAVSQAKTPESLRNFAMTAGRMNSDAAIGPLTRQLKANAEDPLTVQAILEALSRIDHIDAYEALVEATKDSALVAVAESKATAFTPFVDNLLLAASVRMRDPVAVGTVHETLQVLIAADKVPHVRQAAYKAILEKTDERGEYISGALSGDDEILRAAAIAYLLENPSAKTTVLLTKALPMLNAEEQVRVIAALQGIGDKSALPAIQPLVKSSNEMVRQQAVMALGALGDAGTAEELFSLAGNTEDAAELATLSRALGQIADPAMVQILQKKFPDANPAMAKIIAELLVQKRVPSSQALFLKRLPEADRTLAVALLAAVGEIGTEESVLPLVEHLQNPTQILTKDRIRSTLAHIAKNNRQTSAPAYLSIYAGQDIVVQAELLDALVMIGSRESYAPVRSALQGKDDTLRLAAIRALEKWPDASPADDLLEHAKNTPVQREKILALRSLAAVIDRDRSLDEEQKQTLRTRALEAADRDEEKQLFLKTPKK